MILARALRKIADQARTIRRLRRDLQCMTLAYRAVCADNRRLR